MNEEFLKKLNECFSGDQRDMILRAYDFAAKAHAGQKRDSGEEYIIHPLGVAVILMELGMDADTVAAGLLHDVIEDTPCTYEDIKEAFGVSIADLVDGVTRLLQFNFSSKEEEKAESLRKMFFAMAKDIRVIVIKLADRLHNMRTLAYRDPVKQKSKARETLDIYAPLANRLGIFNIKWELEDLALMYLEPEAYRELKEKVAMKRDEREAYIKTVIDAIRAKMDEVGIECEISGRPKHFYSIYKKMKYQNKSFDLIFDLIAVRVIVKTVKDCYAVLGIVHTMWKPIPGRFKDYIAMPKPNMYQSLHTTVIGPNGSPFEIQIRTEEMHQTAEFGIAAHWKYKEGRNVDTEFGEKLNWVRQVVEWQSDKDSKEFMDTLKIDLFSDEVFVFTPKGDVVDLPMGATPLDYAYHIHSAIGNKCVGAKVNKKMVPLDYTLKTGDIVEIVTSAASHGPSRDWLNIVKSSEARSKIRSWFKKELKEENIVKGKDILEKEAKRLGYPLSSLMKSEWLAPLMKKYTLNTVQDLYASIGYGGLGVNQVLPRLVESYRLEIAREEAAQEKLSETTQKAETPAARHGADSSGVIVKGEENMLVRFAHCCNPVPGDPIIGYITRGRGVSVHRADCPNIHDLEAERAIEVAWSENQPEITYNADLQIVAYDRGGLFAKISALIAEKKIHISAINARSKDDMAILNLSLCVSSAEQLSSIMKALLKLGDVLEVYRV
ncbi:MAG: bifunctional (p)ppGpp synthetase/guanosine-3',5'-bis(diphosphate) 3'-pyrophosphohydrolase [Eubacteriales bacterium]|nr:bifunctional (p)ppGpp synthetase/guanosine-3',5'-bis(diphosphate) 3'-pyrophosphohydrolase [Eubacteriales bacterium]